MIGIVCVILGKDSTGAATPLRQPLLLTDEALAQDSP